MTQAVVGLFDEPGAAQRAVEDLLESGFDRQHVGMLAQDVRSESARVLSWTWKGLLVGAIAGTTLSVSALFISRFELALAGVSFALLAGAALGALVGGLIGAFSAHGRRREGALLTVDAEDAEQAARAVEIFKRHGAANSASRISPHDSKAGEYRGMRAP
jgi:hypothetical protein